MTDEVKNASLEALRRRWDFEKSPKLTLQLAEEYGRAGAQQEAIAVLRGGLEAHPGHVASRVLLGRYLVELEEWPEARETLEGVTDGDPTHLVANKLLVRTYLKTGQWTEARNRLDLYSLLNAADPDVEELEKRLAAALQETPAPPGAGGGSAGDREGVAEPEEVSAPAEEAPAETEEALDGIEEVIAGIEEAPAESAGPAAGREGETFSVDRAGSLPPEPAVEEPFGPRPGAAGRERPTDRAEPFGDLWSGLQARRSRPAGAAGQVFDLGPAKRRPREAHGAEAASSAEPAAPVVPVLPPPAEDEAPDATVTLGNLYLEQGHPREAARIFTEILRREDNPAARIGLAAAEAAQGRPLTARDLVGPEALHATSAGQRKRAVLEGYLARLKSSRPTPAAGGSH